MGLLSSKTRHDPLPERLDAVEPFVRTLFEELHLRCQQEKEQYAEAGQNPSAQKVNFWDGHIGPENIDSHTSRSRLFLQSFDDFRSGQHFSKEQLRFAVLVQHFVSQDTMDFRRPPEKRMHDDVFEGILTSSVNAQLITDAHRAEWAIEGDGFIVPKTQSDEERKQLIADFGSGLVTALEQFLLAYCKRRQLSTKGTDYLIQAVTTQMSQCGLANLDRCSRVGQYMVGGGGLKQHVNYNISCMNGGPLGEALKLTLGCLKEGFNFYQSTNGRLVEDGPQCCDPSSRMYQCATLRFTTKLGLETPDGEDDVSCDVIDAYDEVRICPSNSIDSHRET
eukprot:symbB.v1.2.040634.t1/scaffold7393.1/size13733/1